MLQVTESGSVKLDTGGFRGVSSHVAPEYVLLLLDQCCAQTVLASNAADESCSCSLACALLMAVTSKVAANSICAAVPFCKGSLACLGLIQALHVLMFWDMQPTSLVAMNEALKVLGMKISGPSFSQWTISDGRSIVRYEDGVVCHFFDPKLLCMFHI